MSEIETGSTELPLFKALAHNLRRLPKAASWTALLSGVLVVFVSTTGPIAILYQAAAAADMPIELTNSWLFAVFLGSGLFGLLLTLRFGIPIIGSWASTTTALLVTGLVDHPFSEVIGAYFGASILLMIVGYTGIFNKLMQSIPHAIIMAMLAGVLLVFGTRIFTSTRINPLLGLLMLFVFYLGRTLKWRAPLLASFAVGLITVIAQSKIDIPPLSFEVVTPVWTNPTFSIGSFFTLTIPIFNLSAMTATIAISPDSDPNPKTRYFAGVASGVAYSVAALFAGIFSTLYGAFPLELTAILAGLALLPVITASLSDALEKKDFRDSAVVTFLVTISGVSGWGVGAPFWGLLAGIAVHRFSEIRASRQSR